MGWFDAQLDDTRPLADIDSPMFTSGVPDDRTWGGVDAPPDDSDPRPEPLEWPEEMRGIYG